MTEAAAAATPAPTPAALFAGFSSVRRSGFVGVFPFLDEAIDNAKEAIDLWLVGR